MAPKNNEGCSRSRLSSNGSGSSKKVVNKGAWTVEEDRKLAEYIEVHGAKKWKTVALKAGLNRCGKSCRLRWLNYLRPNIKRGNISDAEEDLIIRLHKLLGNRWSLIAGRLPGRTDNEIKNYWNSHLSKRANPKDRQTRIPPPPLPPLPSPKDRGFPPSEKAADDVSAAANTDSGVTFDVDDFFDFSTEGTHGLDWVNKFLELDEDPDWLID